MEDPILATLKEARLKGWQRVQELVGEMAHEWLNLDDDNPSPVIAERLEVLKKQAFELLDTLIPNCGWLRYGVYDPEDGDTGLVIVKICHDSVEFSLNDCTTVPIVRPASDSLQPEAIDLLKVLEG